MVKFHHIYSGIPWRPGSWCASSPLCRAGC